MVVRPTSTDPWAPLFEKLAALRASWPSRGWSWDSRLECVTSSFSAQFESAARAAALTALPVEWTPAGLAQAPERLRDLAERSGGLRSAQLIFTDQQAIAYRAFGLWWPWGNGTTISLRVGIDHPDARPSHLGRLRDVFNVEA